MNAYSRFAKVVLVAICPLAQAIAQDVSNADLINQLATSNNLPSDTLKVASRSNLTLPVTGVRLTVAKVYDNVTNQWYVSALDQNGKVVDLAAAQAAETWASYQKYGKLDPKLANQVKAAEQGLAPSSIPVSIWLNIPDPPLTRPRGATPEELDAAQSAYLNSLQHYTENARTSLLDTVKTMDPNASTGTYSPTVFATLTPGQIRRLEKHPGVGTLYAQDRNRQMLDDSATTSRSYRVWAGGNLGAGTRFAVHEDDGISDSNPYLNNATHPVIFFCAAVNSLCPLGKNIADHATVVAGIGASTHPLYRGHAPNEQVILSANSQNLNSDSQNVAAFEWAVGNSASVVNMSWGQICPDGNLNFAGRYADWANKNLAITQTISSGNTSGCSGDDLRVSMPGGAWSPITVGAFSDNNNGFWFDDAMAGFSRFHNPNTGVNKPEVVNVGVNIASTDSQGGDWLGFGWNGTSFSAPNTAGSVLQMISRRPSQRFWPETNKATIMASAMHDVVGGFFGNDQDGVGAVVSTIADDTYKNGRFRNASVSTSNMTQSCGPIGTTAVCISYLDAFTVNAGTRTRVAIAWDSQSTGGAGTDILGADIDLYVVRPDNVTIQAASASSLNADEVVEFVAPVTGAYDIYIRRFSNDPSWTGTFLGTAWAFGTTATIPNFCTGASATTIGATFVGNIARTINTTNGGTYFDSYTGWGFDQSGREGLIQLVVQGPRTLTVSDTNGNIDLHLLQLTGAGCNGNPVTYNPLLHTINGPASVSVPAGTFYLVGDGFNGAVGATSVTIGVSP
jgi:hypothetical protein